MRFPTVELRLPAWIEDFIPDPDKTFPTPEDRMRLAVELARENVRHGTGGPFGAAIFERDTGKLVAPGVNLVVTAGCSAFHAEMVAIMVAQHSTGSFDLGADGMPFHEMAASTEPCAMCLGATPWSGVRSLICGARDEDAGAIGFDEGPKPPMWTDRFEERGIAVMRDVLREEAVAVLREYAATGGEIYNSRGGG